MTNFDKVKELWSLEDLYEGDPVVKAGFTSQICDIIRMIRNKNPLEYCSPFNSCDRCYKWLKQEYKEPILTEEEKKYLSNVIKPFKNKVLSISKHEYLRVTEGVGYIKIYIKDDLNDDCINLPNFTAGTMYEGMELGVDYIPEELGIR